MIGEMKMMKTKRMIGIDNVSLSDIFKSQMNNQMLIFRKGLYKGKEEIPQSLPIDSISLSSYHILQLMSELGEVLDADKRWKNFRNSKYDKDAKVEEIADCFIVLMNIAMFSGIDADDLVGGLVNKLNIVRNRIMNEK